MKKNKKFVCIVIICFFSCFFSPTITKCQTTLEEYNYLTKGIKIQLENGLDMKKGYSLEEVDKARFEVRSAVLSRLTRSDSKIAAYLLRYQKDENSVVEYYCIPHPKSTQGIKDLFFESLKPTNFDVNSKLALFTFLLSRNLNWLGEN